jgi:hypothetical protein
MINDLKLSIISFNERRKHPSFLCEFLPDMLGWLPIRTSRNYPRYVAPSCGKIRSKHACWPGIPHQVSDTELVAAFQAYF